MNRFGFSAGRWRLFILPFTGDRAGQRLLRGTARYLCQETACDIKRSPQRRRAPTGGYFVDRKAG